MKSLQPVVFMTPRIRILNFWPSNILVQVKFKRRSLLKIFKWGQSSSIFILTYENHHSKQIHIALIMKYLHIVSDSDASFTQRTSCEERRRIFGSSKNQLNAKSSPGPVAAAISKKKEVHISFIS